MHTIQSKLIELAKKQNLAKMTLRGMASAIGLPKASPQMIKHHLLQVQKRGFLTIDKSRGLMARSGTKPGVANGLVKKTSHLFSIPIIGTANCGSATIFAEQNFKGFLKVSSRLIGRSSPKGLFAIRADGSSMNRAEINGKKIEDGDYVIINNEDCSPKTKDVVLAIIDDKATIKRFIEDRANDQIILKADSSFDYEPIYLHSEDSFTINGKVISVVKK
ncbi:hypothetical protein C4546_01325 [Candidatus Parcubacteria bacterium]|jgi:repressor LexA|nr:MAG: hypothetical protein C4546_01325 [Candidatus Parcubacteria bacterium]